MLAQQVDHVRNLFIVIALRHHPQGFQRVVQKVRLDLGLQRVVGRVLLEHLRGLSILGHFLHAQQQIIVGLG